MQLGKALVGAIIGAAVGIGMLIAVYLTLKIDKFWLAIPFAIITGLGVRMLVTAGHASYVRGVLTMLLAMAAYFVGLTVVAKVATARANKVALKPAITVEETAETDTTDGETTKEETPPPAPPVALPRNTEAPTMRSAAPGPGSPWDIIWLAVAALAAYELGRGSSSAMAATAPAAPATAVHPDA